MSPPFCSEQSSDTWIEIAQSHYKCISDFYDPFHSFAHSVPLRLIFRSFNRQFFTIFVHEAVFCNFVPLNFWFSPHAIDPFDFI